MGRHVAVTCELCCVRAATGISQYTLEPATGKVLEQQDYWDSLNLQDGEYRKKGVLDGVRDFVGQLAPPRWSGIPGGLSQANEGETPYQLLRRGSTYEVRRYPALQSLVTPEGPGAQGLARAYASGTNKEHRGLAPLSWSVSDGSAQFWPLGDGGSTSVTPQPTSPEVEIRELSCDVVAVARVPAEGGRMLSTSEDAVRRAAEDLMEVCRRDRLGPVVSGDGSAAAPLLSQWQVDGPNGGTAFECEVWVRLQNHDWR